MIFYVSTTDKGIALAKQYDGTNNGINFLEATILALSNGGISMHDLIVAIHNNYPHEIRDDNLSEKIRQLGKQGYCDIIDEVNDGTAVMVSFFLNDGIGDKAILTRQNLGVFIHLNKLNPKEVIEALQWDGEFSTIINEIGVHIEIAI